ncbi:MAG: glucose-6-phosphate isomerase [Bacteroidales bacterium]|nr:glucose-6-phosphate isomerase [Bacteroidales bacterium]
MKIITDNAISFINKNTVTQYQEKAKEANKQLHNKTGKGNDFLGWVDLPNQIFENLINDIEATVNNLKDKIEIMVTIGTGGSYLGAKAVIEALSDNFSLLKEKQEYPVMLFAGQNLSEDYLFELRELLKNKDYALTIISKSGTTTEPAVAFRLLKKDLEDKYGKEEAKNRIIAVTDKEKGALKQLSDKEDYKTFVIPDDVGGRFSVLTPVGLIPIAFAGFDIRKLIKGAKEMAEKTSDKVKFENNPAEIYALTRNLLYQNLYSIEILVNYNPKLSFIAEWWKQLYGESEGKDGKGIFPASVSYTTDLHSMGQYIQDGKRNLFETVISVEKAKHKIVLEEDEANLDKLNYLAGKRIEEINKSAEQGTTIAHLEGKVPNIRITIPEVNEYYLGELIYFFEKACGISGYILDVNPFDQPGVEAYKKKMFELLGKPGI